MIPPSLLASTLIESSPGPQPQPEADSEPGVLIVGAGQAGVQTAEALRSGGYSGPITLLGEEPHAPYHRPPLSKAWLCGELQAAQLLMRAPEALVRKGIALRLGVRVQAIDRTQRRLHLADGSTLPYAALVLATGASPRTLALPGAPAAPAAQQAAGVLSLRGLDDASALAARLADCQRRAQPLLVIGGGFIGLEVAASARKLGLEVTVLEAAPRLLGRVLAPALSDWFAELHRRHGVQVRLGAQLAALETGPDGQVLGARLADGSFCPGAAVLVGIGVQANDALAQAAGLECERGIVVDACGRSSDAHICAAGDCTARRLPDGTLLRLESVHNATEQAKSVAAAILGQERPFTATPWFWSEQYDKKLQMAGLSAGADQWALRGAMDDGAFSLYHFRGQRLLAVDSVNATREHLQARKLLDAGVSPTPAQAADPAFDLSSLLAAG